MLSLAEAMASELSCVKRENGYQGRIRGRREEGMILISLEYDFPNRTASAVMPMHRSHLWSFDVEAERISDGRPIRMLNIADEYSRECLKIHINPQLKTTDVIYELSGLFVERGVPYYLRSDNGSEFTQT